MKVIKLDENFISLKFIFDKPELVSPGDSKDIIESKVVDNHFFCSQEGPRCIEKGTIITFELPKMLSGSFAVALEYSETAVTASTNSIVLTNVLVTIALSISLKRLWNLLNVLQVLVFTRNFCAWPAMIDGTLNFLHEIVTQNKMTK